jgi:hypothetical protein
VPHSAPGASLVLHLGLEHMLHTCDELVGMTHQLMERMQVPTSAFDALEGPGYLADGRNGVIPLITDRT